MHVKKCIIKCFAGCLDYTVYFGVLTNYGGFVLILLPRNLQSIVILCACTIIGKDIIMQNPDGMELILWRMGVRGQIINN